MEEFNFEKAAIELENTANIIITFSSCAENEGLFSAYYSVIYAALEKVQNLRVDINAAIGKRYIAMIDENQEEICNIYERLDVIGRAEVFVYANSVINKALSHDE